MDSPTEEETVKKAFKEAYSLGFWHGATTAFFATVALVILIGAYVPLP